MVGVAAYGQNWVLKAWHAHEGGGGRDMLSLEAWPCDLEAWPR